MLNIQSTLDQISARAIDQSKVFGTSFLSGIVIKNGIHAPAICR